MKKGISISLLFIFFCAYTEIGQLLKVPYLVHHFIEHHQQGEHHNSISQFLKGHYSDGEKKASKEDHEDEHRHLPFKSIDNLSAFTSDIIHNESVFFPRRIPYLTGSNILISFCEGHYSNNVAATIWQPPKFI